MTKCTIHQPEVMCGIFIQISIEYSISEQWRPGRYGQAPYSVVSSLGLHCTSMPHNKRYAYNFYGLMKA